MNNRRQLLAIFLTLCLPLTSKGQTLQFPDRPVKIIVPFGVGGLADITFRIFSEKLSAVTGKQFVIENMPGSGGFAAAQALLRAKPDGHTLMVMVNGTAISKSLYKNMPYDPVKDLIPVSFAAYFDVILLVKADSKIKNFNDLIKLSKDSTKGLDFGTINPGSTQNLSAELFKSVTHTHAEIIPFKSTPDALSALMAGELDVVFETYATSKSLVDSGKLLAIATTAAQRSGYLPKVPTVSELGFKRFEVVGWNALAAPVGTPPDVVQYLNKAMNTVADMPEVKQKLNALGSDSYAGSSQELQKRFLDDIAKWANVIKNSGIQVQ